MREIRNHSQRQRIHYSQELRRGGRVAAPGIPLPQTSTLRSRRHLANLLIASALIFIACWSPHVFCVFYKHLGYKEYCSKTSIYFNLLLGKYILKSTQPTLYSNIYIILTSIYRLYVFGYKSHNILGT